MVRVEQINQVNNVISLTERVNRRKQELLAAKPHLCAERSRLITESWKETVDEPLDIRRAKAFKKVMEGLSVTIKEGELIVGSQTKYVRGSGPAVEWDSDFVFELFEGDAIRLSGVASMAAEVTEAEKASLLEDATYWKGKTPTEVMLKTWNEVFGNKLADAIEARVIHRPAQARPNISEIGDWGKVLQKGLNGIITEAREGLEKLSRSGFSGNDAFNKYNFLQAVIIACQGAINFAQRYAKLARELASRENDAVRKDELEKIANVCEWVPANPARSFHEAVQSYWFTHLTAQLEFAFSGPCPGRMDQYLYPFYKKDIEEGRITSQEAAELLGCLWVKFAEMDCSRGRIWKEVGQTNMGQNMTIGGVTSDGKDASNELTYLLLEVNKQLKTVQPPLYLRVHKDTPEELWMKAVEVNRDRGDGNPAYVNDEALVPNYVAKGITLEDARNWATRGCVHNDVSGASYGDIIINTFNHAKILELTLNNGVDPRTGKQLGLATGDPRDFSCFEELYDALKKQVDYLAKAGDEYMNLSYQVRNQYYSLPFFSALMNDCIEKGVDYMKGGVRYPQLYYGIYERGHQNVADSLTAIKKLVFEEKKITMDQLLEALRANFEGNENDKIRSMLKSAPKYGNDNDYADAQLNDFSSWTQRRLSQCERYRGNNFTSSRGGATQHLFFGKTVGALPDGKKAWEPLADGTQSPVGGVDVKGPTAAINSASKVNHTELNTSTLFNLKVDPAILQSKEGLEKFIALIKTYFQRGGYQIQFNLMGTKLLLEAKKNPEQYRDLLVRVAGFSAYFVELSSQLQDEIIARTEHVFSVH